MKKPEHHRITPEVVEQANALYDLAAKAEAEIKVHAEKRDFIQAKIDRLADLVRESRYKANDLATGRMKPTEA